MALSMHEVRGLLGRADNDNPPLPSELRRAAAAEVVPIHRRAPNLDITLPNLETRLETATGILWARMAHPERACYTPELMQDMRDIQRYLRETFAGAKAEELPFRYLVWASDAPKAWSLGGDLTNFTAMIRSGDEEGLRRYAHQAIEILHENYTCMDLPILTCALVQGDAVGGGFEAMLTDDIVIAERGAKFGMPEILFNLFPGMGGFSFLKRKVGTRMARQLIEDGLSRSADEVQELGLIDVVAEAGEGEAALRRFIADNENRFNTLRTLRDVRRRVDPVTREELLDVVDMWTDLAMKLCEDELRRMDCLARVQTKKRRA